MAVYTKKGDRGETGSYGEEKESKDSLRIRAIGAIDEASSYLGVVWVTGEKELRTKLREIQANLFMVGSVLSGAKLTFSPDKTKQLEKEIDLLERILPPLNNFILPGEGKVSAGLFYARALARRAERAVVGLSKEIKITPEILVYLNRLSDYLYMKAREQDYNNGVKETVWKLQNK